MGNQAKRRRGADLACLGLLVLGSLWDLAGRWLEPPAWWHVASFAIIALAATSGLASVVVDLVRPVGRRFRVGTLVVMLLLVTSLVLRGHPEIPPDPPLIAVEIFGVLMISASLLRRATFRQQ